MLKREARKGHLQFRCPVEFRRPDGVESRNLLISRVRQGASLTYEYLRFGVPDSLSVFDANGACIPGDYAAWLQFICCNSSDTAEFDSQKKAGVLRLNGERAS